MDKKLLENLEKVKIAKEEHDRILLTLETDELKYFDEGDSTFGVDIPEYNGPWGPCISLCPGSIDKLKEQYQMEIPYKTYPSKYNGIDDWKPHAIIWGIMIFLALLGGATMFFGFLNMNEFGPGAVIGGGAIIGVGLLTLLIAVIVKIAKCNIENNHIFKEQKKTIDRENYEIELKNVAIKANNEKIDNEIGKLEKRLEQYEIEKANYEKEYKVYLEAREEYDKKTKDLYKKRNEIKKQREKESIKRVRKENSEKEKLAEKKLHDALEHDDFYFPEAYIYSISDLIGYIKNARADSLKEAINLYEKEKRENEFYMEQQRENNHKYLVEYTYVDLHGFVENRTATVRARSAEDACAQVEGARFARKLD